MIKDGKDTDYNRLGYYPHYWIDEGIGGYVIKRTTNNRDKVMLNEDGAVLVGTYRQVYELAKKLNAQNTGLKKRSN